MTPGAIKAARWRRNHPERVVEVRRDYYLRHRERLIKESVARQKADPKRKSIRDHKYREKHKEQKKKKDKTYYEKNRSTILPKVRASAKRLVESRKQNGLCLECGEPALTGKSLCNKHRKEMSDRDKNRWKKKGLLCNSTGMVLEELEILLEDQGYHCFLCPINLGTRQLAKDHDHRENCPHNTHTVCPNCFRGFLCHGCNIRVGSIEKNPDWATEKEVLYLDRRPVLDMRRQV